MENLEKLRKEIDDIDKSIVELLNKRALLAKKIGNVKKENVLEVIDFSREREVFKKIIFNSENIIPEEDLKTIYREIIASSRKLQKSYVVSFLGPEGSFSSVAFKKFFGKNTQYKLSKNIKEVFNDVNNSNSKFGVVPVENSIEGSVNITLDCLFEFNLKIWAEIMLRINFNFVSFAENEKDINKIYSHPHALAQCREFISKNFKNAELIHISSTSESIKYIKDFPDSGAIVAPSFTDIYNVPVIFRNISDNTNNFTRFYVMSQNENRIKKGDKTSFMFAVSHKPRSLFKALEVVAKYGLNMCKIESRPIKGIPWEYLFYADIEGGLKEDFMEEFKTVTTFFKSLGYYPVEILG